MYVAVFIDTYPSVWVEVTMVQCESERVVAPIYCLLLVKGNL